MQEKILDKKRNGLAMLLLIILVYAAGIACFVCGVVQSEKNTTALSLAMSIVGGFWIGAGWIPLMGLKVLKPQEALVLTLFGKYVGTLKKEGFYYVNPFCTGVNPAARTRLGQSGDVDGGSGKTLVISGGAGTLNTESIGKKISMKIMTLNNSRQKINDCLGNPVEIGIAVTWRVVDTAKAVFQVDNYKE